MNKKLDTRTPKHIRRKVTVVIMVIILVFSALVLAEIKGKILQNIAKPLSQIFEKSTKNEKEDELVDLLNKIFNNCYDLTYRKYYGQNITGLHDYREYLNRAKDIALSVDSNFFNDFTDYLNRIKHPSDPKVLSLDQYVYGIEDRDGRYRSYFHGIEGAQHWAAWTLGKIASKAAITVLINSISDATNEKQNYIIEALLNAGSKAVPQLIESYKKGQSSYAIKVALMKIGDPRGISVLLDKLLEELTYWDRYVREAAALALSNGNPEEIIPRLIKAIEESNNKDYLWHYAGESLSKIKNPNAITPLSNALKSTNPWVRENTVKALGNMFGIKKANPLLIDALKDENANVRLYAVESLGLINKRKHESGRLESLVKKKWFFTPQEILHLTEAMKDPDKDVRYKVAWTLGEIGNPKAIPTLREAFKNKDPMLREQAVLSIYKIEGSRAVPYLKKALEDEDEWVRKVAGFSLCVIDSTYLTMIDSTIFKSDVTAPEGVLIFGKNFTAYIRQYSDNGGYVGSINPITIYTSGRLYGYAGLRWASLALEPYVEYKEGEYGQSRYEDWYDLSEYSMIFRIRGRKGSEKVWMNFKDDRSYGAYWGLVKLPPLSDNITTFVINFSKLKDRLNTSHIEQIIFNFGGHAWDEILNPGGATIQIEDVRFVRNT